MKVRFALLVVVLSSSCKRGAPDETIRKAEDPPASPSASTSAVASSAPSAVPSTVVAEDGSCRVRGLVAEDGFGYGGLGLSSGPMGDAGSDEGIGLGSIGGFGLGSGFGSGPSTSTESLEGTFGASSGPLSRRQAGAPLCVANRALNACFAASLASSPTLDLDLTFGITVDPLGNAHATPKSTIADATLSACLVAVMEKVSFPASSGPTSFDYELEYRRRRVTPTAKLSDHDVEVKGKLPPEIVERIVRANFPRFRACYEMALKTTPTLTGTVSTKFVIDTTGAVESVAPLPGTITHVAMSKCVRGVFETLSYPEPEAGKVVVVFPIEFAPP